MSEPFHLRPEEWEVLRGVFQRLDAASTEVEPTNGYLQADICLEIWPGAGKRIAGIRLKVGDE